MSVEFADLSGSTPLIESDPEAGITRVEVVLAPGESVPLHQHDCAEIGFLLEGSVRVERNATSVDIRGLTAFQIPKNVSHRYTNTGATDAKLLLGYGHGAHSESSVSTSTGNDMLPDSGADPNAVPSARLESSWVIAEDSRPWMPIELSKGMRVRAKILVDLCGDHPDFLGGLVELDPHTHYTLHRHRPAELYYVISGSGTVFNGTSAHDVVPGLTVLVPPYGVHGIDSRDAGVRALWFYCLDGDPEWQWEPTEPIYADVGP